MVIILLYWKNARLRHRLTRSGAMLWLYAMRGRMNMTTEATANPQEINLQNCLMGKFAGTDLVVCREGIMPCKWAMPFGDLLFLNRPSATQLVDKMEL